METARQTTLREQPEIINLFQMLEGNGLTGEREKVELLLDYLDSLDHRFNQVMEELQEVKGQLAQIQDKGVKSNATHVVRRAEVKIQETGVHIEAVKKNLISSEKHIVAAVKEKGKDALKHVVSAMRILDVLTHLKEVLHDSAKCMEKEAAKLEMISGEFHSIGEHTKNISRMLIGRPKQESAEKHSDKGVLIKMQWLCLSCGRQLSDMEEKTVEVLNRMEQFTVREPKKESVKEALKRIKSEKSVSQTIQPPMKEKER